MEDTTDDVPLSVGLRERLLSEQDLLLFHSLVAGLAADAVILPKARLADFLYLKNASRQLKHAIRMDRKMVDFLLCDPISMQPLAVIERVEPESSKTTAPRRDPFVAESLKQAGILLLKVKTRRSYPANQLRELILPKISSVTKAQENSQTVDPSLCDTKTDLGFTQSDVRESLISDPDSKASDNRIDGSQKNPQPVIISRRTIST